MTSVRHHGAASCYACDGVVVGVRDRRPEGGGIEAACRRHADPAVRVIWTCIYCDGPVRRGSIRIDGDHAHAACHAKESI